jgi:hypothetical protein
MEAPDVNPARSADQAREIARRAYTLWEEEGHPHGRDRDHWVRAERELALAPAAPKAAAQPAASPLPETPAKKPATRRKPAAETAPAAKPAGRRKTPTGA